MLNVEDYVGLNYRMLLRRGEEGGYVAEVEEFSGCMADGETPDEAVENLKPAMRVWIASRQEAGLPVPAPRGDEEFSGKFVVRVPKFLHARLAREAEAEGVSLNQYLVSVLSLASENRSAGTCEAVTRYLPGQNMTYCGQSQGWGWAGRLNQPCAWKLTSDWYGYSLTAIVPSVVAATEPLLASPGAAKPSATTPGTVNRLESKLVA